MRRITLLYILALHALLALLLWNKLGRRVEFPAGFEALVTFHQRVLGNVPDGFVAVLGDSHVQGLTVTRLHPQAINLGIGGDTTTGLLRRLPNYPQLSHAAAIVLAIGLNDLRVRSAEETAAGIQEILDRLPAGVPIVCSAVLPVAADAPGRAGYAERIAQLNRLLRSGCAADPRCSFVDAGPALVDDSGALAPGLHVGDGVHLSPRGAEVWIETLRDGLAQRLPPVG